MIGVKASTPYMPVAVTVNVAVGLGYSVAAGHAAFRYSWMSSSHRLVRSTVTVAGGA